MRFHQFKIKRVLVKMHMPTKKYLRIKAKKLCLMGQIVIESHSQSGVLAEP